jgi:hypothetical protein
MKGLFDDFSKIQHVPQHVRVVRESDYPPVWTVYLDTTGYFTVRGRENEGPVCLPRNFIWTIGEAENGAEGLNYINAKVWWDTALLAGKLPGDAVTFRQNSGILSGS